MKAAPLQLDDLGQDLCALARSGRLDPVAGREQIIERVGQILARKTKRNALLLGEPGVGKSAIVEGLAQRIVEGSAPRHLRGRSIFSLHLGSLVAGTSCRGDFEQRLQGLVGELLRTASRRILFIDEIHLLDRAGRGEGGLDAANLLKPLLARGELCCIGATTPTEWRGMLDRDPALGRRFLEVEVPEATRDETLCILQALRPRFESHHDVEISEALLESLLAQDMPPGSRLPDYAIDRLDEACAKARTSSSAVHSAESQALRSLLEEARDRFDLYAYAGLKARLAALSGSRARLGVLV